MLQKIIVGFTFVALLFIGVISAQTANTNSQSKTVEASQTENTFTLPKVEDVQKIETTDNKFRYQTPESLLRILPHLTLRMTGKFKKDHGNAYQNQYGTITLKDGTILKWRSSAHTIVSFYNDKSEQVYYVESETIWSFVLTTTLPIFGIIVIMCLLAGFSNYKRSNPDSRFIRFYNRISNNLIGYIVIRTLVSSPIFYLGYLLLIGFGSLQAISDGVFEVTTRSGGGSVYFADSDPISFWINVLAHSLFGLTAILVGLCVLLVNPKTSFWAAKPKIEINTSVKREPISKILQDEENSASRTRGQSDVGKF